jgi:hypothetical protein
MKFRIDRFRREMAGGATRLAAVVLLVLGFAPASFADGGAHHSGHGGHAGAAASDSPAVASPNIRFEVDYSFFEIGSTDTFDAQGATTLSIDSHDGHSGRAALTAVFPIWGPLGGRAQVRGAYGHRLHSLDGLERGNNEVSASGAGVELFLRNPERYALAIGGGWDRLAQDGPADANEFGGHATARAFFPDLGLGPVDWILHFDFTHRQVDGLPGSTDYDADRYVVRVQSGWYASDNVQLLFGVEWGRFEEEFSSEEGLEGIFEARWLLPVPIVPVELRAGGFAGVSEFKRPPFRGDRRLIYGARVGLVLRYGAGKTLIENQRRYD